MEMLLMSFLIPPFLFVLSFVLTNCWKNRSKIRHLGIIKGLLVNCIFGNQGKLPKNWHLDNDGRAVMSIQMKEYLSISKIHWKVDHDNYDKYCFLCGYESFEPASSLDPPCYPEVAFIIPTMSVISSKRFPLSPLGLIHVTQTIKVYCPLNLEDSSNFLLDLNTSEMRATSKGIEVDFLFKVYNLNEELVWESVMTVLSRDQSTRHRNKNGAINKRLNDDAIQEDNTVAFNVPESVGWEYANVSSDYNPHHLNSFTSRLATGYPRPMAHGMWTLARVMAILNNKIDSVTDQSVYPLFVNVQFKRPLFLPNSALLKYKAIKPSLEEATQFKYKDCHSKTVTFRVFSEDLLSSSNTLSSLNMIGFITYNAAIIS